MSLEPDAQFGQYRIISPRYAVPPLTDGPRSSVTGNIYRMRRWFPLAGLILLLALVFGTLVTANSAGYRFGISDQAFYIPAIDLWRWPDLFPRDRLLLEPQARLTVIDEAFGWICRVTGLSLEPVFFLAYTCTIVVFTAGVALVGRSLFRSPWAIAILTVALSLRHRIPETAANTFEGYFHPRVLAFALGLVGIGLFLHGARRTALTVSALAVAVHPTTGGWFLVWLGAAAWVMASIRTRWIIGISGAVMMLAIALLAREELAARLTIMDPAWIAAFSGRDYVFPTSSWSVGTWLALLVGPAIVLAVSTWRRRTGDSSPSERAIALGALSLFGIFLLSLPFIAARVALAVQLQTSRVFWPIEFLATAYVVWVLTEAPWTVKPTHLRARIVLAILLVAAAARGVYVLRIEHHNPLVAVWPQETDWRRLGRWIAATTPRDAHFLVDPEHVYRYGSSFRVVAHRDVLVEAVKDRAMAMYSRKAALRVEERLQAAGDVSVLDEGRIAALARQYDLDYLVTERELDFRTVHEEGALHVYRLD
jgi:hypothetical protein